ncbi:3-hydroxyacyl-CoA dehydrogenase [Halomarina oriensis]|uniref:3-hydroxyacyl-CoA dehydrogenase n=1 Tax=Halomarina oriensis TaxID=671145 RepID=A0A6B0GX98_9EURY|nr:3-hydroxyacyl-CoA dehydrogenase [Halomarina oriensis]MWG36765.1 3-hydroxyacyl-CoA dehydrogenase [Halomarina oriensis]
MRTGVVGAGVMGRDIAGLLANAGNSVTLVDVDSDALDAARTYHREELPDALAEAGLGPNGTPAERLDYDTDLDALADARFVVEAVPERLDLKRGLLADLDAVLDPDAVVGTNTSSLTPSAIAADSAHAERVVLFHFANPAIPRDIVEISGDETSTAARDLTVEVAEAIGKHPVVLGAEYRANGLSRLSASIKCAATWELLEASPAAIDGAAQAIGFERGPLEFVDLIGLDVHLATVDNLAEAYGDRYAPPPESRERMERMREEGRLGMKTGEGFFEWDGETCIVPDTDETYDVTPVVAALVNEAHRLVRDGVGDPETVDDILERGSGGDVGPFDVEAMLGEEYLREALVRRHEETGAGVYDPVF